MKTIYEHAIGSDGVVAGLYIDGDSVVEQIRYPMSKALAPVDALIDKSIDGLEAKIPGDWDKAVLEPIRIGAHAELKAFVGG